MLNPDNISEAEYNQRLVLKLESNRESAAIANQQTQPSKKSIHSLLEARATQRKLGGDRTEFKPALAEQPVNEAQDEAKVGYEYIDELDDNIDLLEMFNQAAELMSHNNETNDKEELN